MHKILIGILALLLAVHIITLDIGATKKHFYNNGYHGCGGAWVHCERDTSGTWFYCSKCGHQEQF